MKMKYTTFSVYAHKQRSSKIIERPHTAYDASGDVMTLLLAVFLFWGFV